MKKLLLLLSSVLFLICPSAVSQNDTIWYDSNWNSIERKNASFYRPKVDQKKDGYWIVDYYISGSKQMEGLSIKADTEVFDGKVVWFFENGKTFQEVHYKKGVLDGKRTVFFENGELKSISHYKDGKKDGDWKAMYENGNVMEEGSYENGQKEGNWRIYYANGKLKEEGKYIFDRKVDVWKVNYYDGTEQKEF